MPFCDCGLRLCVSSPHPALPRFLLHAQGDVRAMVLRIPVDPPLRALQVQSVRLLRAWRAVPPALRRRRDHGALRTLLQQDVRRRPLQAVQVQRLR
eukprot:7383328-Prymnesium_polylepis.3